MSPFKADRCPRCCSFTSSTVSPRRANTAGQYSRPLPSNNIQQRRPGLFVLSLPSLIPASNLEAARETTVVQSDRFHDTLNHGPVEGEEGYSCGQRVTSHEYEVLQDAPEVKIGSVSHAKDLLQDVSAKLAQGCFTCRLRRKKCDEAKPKCKACRHLGLDCEYKRPHWWSNNETRRKHKEFIKSIIKRTKTNEKNLAAQSNCPTQCILLPSTCPS